MEFLKVGEQGFAKTGERVWVEFKPSAWNDHFTTKKRAVYVDGLGDKFVYDKEGTHMERLAFGGSIIGWEPVAKLHPNVPTGWIRKGGAR